MSSSFFWFRVIVGLKKTLRTELTGPKQFDSLALGKARGCCSPFLQIRRIGLANNMITCLLAL